MDGGLRVVVEPLERAGEHGAHPQRAGMLGRPPPWPA